MNKLRVYIKTFGKCLLLVFMLSSCEQNKNDGYYIYSHNDSEIDSLDFRYGSNMTSIFIDTYISSTGKIYPFLFDTGSDVTVINTTISPEKMGINYKAWDTKGNQVNLGGTKVDTLKIGGIHFKNTGDYRTYPFENLDGILGGDLFRGFVFKIDFAAKQIYIARGIKSFDTHNQDGIPFEFKGNCPVLDVMVNDQPIKFIIDFGYSGAVSINMRHPLTDQIASIADKVVLWNEYSFDQTPFGQVSNAKPLNTRKFLGDLEVGTILLKDEFIAIDRQAHSLLGQDFFMRFESVILDYPNQKVYLGKLRYKSLSFLENIYQDINTMGVKISNKTTPKITGVLSDRALRGIFFNDTVLEINGVKIYGRDKIFYDKRNEYQRMIIYSNGKELDTMLPIAKTSSLDRVLRNFNFKRSASTIKIKRGNSTLDFDLSRQSNFSNFPDTLQNYIHGGLIFEKYNYKKMFAVRDTLNGVSRERFLYLSK